jgi:hypothetical protein
MHMLFTCAFVCVCVCVCVVGEKGGSVCVGFCLCVCLWSLLVCMHRVRRAESKHVYLRADTENEVWVRAHRITIAIALFRRGAVLLLSSLLTSPQPFHPRNLFLSTTLILPPPK